MSLSVGKPDSKTDSQTDRQSISELVNETRQKYININLDVSLYRICPWIIEQVDRQVS